MNRYTARWMAWSVGILSIALLVAALILFLVDRSRVRLPEDVGTWSLLTGFDIAVSIPVPILGALIASRRPRNAIGWVYLGHIFLFALIAFGQMYAVHALLVDPGVLPGGRFMAWLSGSLFPIAICLLPFLFLLFPTGHLPSSRWRLVAWLAGLVLVCLTAGSITLATRIWSDPFAGTESAVRGLPGTVLPVFIIAVFGFPLTLMLSAVSVVVRFRRSSGDERQQLKWFAAAATLVAASIAVGFFSRAIAASAAVTLSLTFLDVAIAIAVLKYRLYDIDLIIGKTIVYGLLAAFITVVYVVLVVVIGAFIGVTEGLSLLATAIVAVAFQPIRQRAQRIANRLVYGKRATPYEVLSEFSEHVGETYSGEDVLQRMVRLLAEGTGARTTVVWLRIDSELRPAASWPSDGESPAPRAFSGDNLPAFADETLALPVRYQGEILGALSLTKPSNENVSPVEQKLVNDLAAQAGLVLRNSRLIEDLRASRQRLIAAQDEERRRLERNLHDGAQQQLVALAVQARMAEDLAGKDPNRERELLRQVQQGVQEALEELRDLARGIYPPLLVDQGLPAALEAQARKVPMPVSVETDGIGRYPQELEATVYFCVLEALQNATKYAGASEVSVRVWRDDGNLVFAVTDDGRGFDRRTTSLGTGMRNMSDRLAAVGGSLAVQSQRGLGTSVLGRIPIPSVEPG